MPATVAEPLERHLLRSRDLIDSCYAEQLDVPALAAAAGVSPRHFSRRFRETFGETPRQYLISRRIERAKRLLRAGRLSVLEVCLEVGFASPASFTNTFRSRTGSTPSQYKRRFERDPAAREAAERIPSCYAMAWARGRGRASS